MVQPAQASTRVAPTAALTVKSVEQLAGSGTRFAYAVKAGPWIFLNGHEAFDFERGLAGEVEGPSGHRLSGRPPLRREADYILQRMRSTLKEFGCDLANAVRVDQYYTSGQAVHAYHLARFAEFGGYIPPSTSIIMARCFTPRTNIHTSMIAVVPGKNWTIEKITLPGEAISASGYNPAVVVNDFVFVAGNQAFVESGELGPGVAMPPARNWGGQSAFRRQAHYVIRKRLEPSLKAAGPALEHSLKAQVYIRGADNAAAFDALALAGQAQGALLHRYAEGICEAVGVAMGNVVRAQYFLTDIRDFAGVAAAWSDRCGDGPHPFAAVQVPGPLPTSGAAIIGDFWIYAG